MRVDLHRLFICIPLILASTGPFAKEPAPPGATSLAERAGAAIPAEQLALFCGGDGKEDALTPAYGQAITDFLNQRSLQGVSTSKAMSEIRALCFKSGAHDAAARATNTGG